MYPDNFYNFLNSKLSWIVIAIGYALFDYLYNLLMCSILGGITQIRIYYKFLKNQAKVKTLKVSYIEARRNYKIGSQKLLKKFHKDKLSWSWPITTLAIPILIYGVSNKITTDGVLSLTKFGVNINRYSFLPNNEWVQLICWGVALTLSIRTFYRYHKERTKPTWFSKFWPFNLSRAILFDFPLSYMILSTIYIWLQYSTSLFRVLSSNQIQYIILHPDLMYGLEKVYHTVVTMGVMLIILSLLPALMLIREKRQKYNKMYYFLVYGGIVASFFLLSILVIRFNQRLSDIQEFALSNIQTKKLTLLHSDIESIAGLMRFSLISNLPGSFPIPAWFSFLLSARSVALFFEVVRIVSPSASKSNILKYLQKVLEK